MINKKALFLKWIKNLFCIECVVLLALVLENFSVLDSFIRWIRIFLSMASIYCLYKLMPLNNRYQKAVIFSGIATILTLFTNLGILVVLSLPLVICSLIGVYQQFYGHSEMILTIDNKLSKKWRTLFMWNVFGPFIVAIVAPLFILIPVITELFDTSVISIAAAMIGSGFVVILQIVYVIYLKYTHDVCENYEHWEN